MCLLLFLSYVSSVSGRIFPGLEICHWSRQTSDSASSVLPTILNIAILVLVQWQQTFGASEKILCHSKLEMLGKKHMFYYQPTSPFPKNVFKVFHSGTDQIKICLALGRLSQHYTMRCNIHSLGCFALSANTFPPESHQCWLHSDNKLKHSCSLKLWVLSASLLGLADKVRGLGLFLSFIHFTVDIKF